MTVRTATELKLLLQFRKTVDRDKLFRNQTWAEWYKFDDGLKNTFRRFLEDGLIEEADVACRLSALAAHELRDALRARGLAVGGSKQVLVDRLAARVSDSEARMITKDAALFQLTNRGRLLLDELVETEFRLYEEAKKKTADALRAGQLDKARSICKRYFSKRGNVIDGVRGLPPLPNSVDLDHLDLFATVEIDALHYLTSAQREQLAVAAGMLFLWNDDPTDFLPSDFPNSPRSAGTAAKFVLDAARRSAGYQGRSQTCDWYLISWGGAPCEVCLGYEERRFKPTIPLPNLPSRDCTSTEGCGYGVVNDWYSGEGRTFVVESDLELLSAPDPVEALQNAKRLHESGLISDSEFAEIRTSVIDRLKGRGSS